MPNHDLDDDEWQDMPVILPSKDLSTDDDWDRRRGRWPSSTASATRPSQIRSPEFGGYDSSYTATAQGDVAAGNATGRFVDFDHKGDGWREKGKNEVDEMDYTRLELDDDPDEDEISMRTQYLFNEDKGMTPLSQMQATKTLLTEGQRIAYVGLCRLVAREMVQTLALACKGAKELEPSRESCKHWANKIMGRLYRHMDVDGAEQRMIEQLAEHGVTAEDLVPSLLTTYSIDNPEYDPEAELAAAEEAREAAAQEEEEALRREDERAAAALEREGRQAEENAKEEEVEGERLRLEEEERGRAATEVTEIGRRESEAREGDLPPPLSTPLRSSTRTPPKSPQSASKSPSTHLPRPIAMDEWDEGDIGAALDSPSQKPSLSLSSTQEPSTPKLGSTAPEDEPPTPKASPLPPALSPSPESSPEEQDLDSFTTPLPSTLPGVSTTLSAADKTITLDIRWTILCDLFLSLIADSVYDARSRVLLGRMADKLGLEWIDVVRFERRLTEALEIQEAVKSKEHEEVLEKRANKDKKARYMMMGLATLGGGLVIGLSAGLLAPVIGAGLGAALTTVGVSGTTTFLAGAGGSAIIASGATITGATIGGKAMAKRTRNVKTFDVQPLHNNKRVNFFITIPGFMNGPLDDIRLPFSVIDPLMGDVFSVLWEPEMMGDTGNALKILSTEVFTQAGQQVLAMTVMTALMSALQWPMMLTKLSYLIDNPWSNALDRAKQAGAILADILINRRLGVRPVSLVGFSLGARVIFYALVELAKANAFGVVQEVYLFGATVTASLKIWRQVRGIVAGRFVNAFAMNDWVLGYLFRATSGGLQTVAGLRPIEHIPELENIDVTHILQGHMSYRTLMPKLLAYVGFKVTADHFDEPEEMELDAPEREIVTKEEEERRREAKERKKGLGIFRRKKATSSAPMSRTPSGDYDDMPPRHSNASGSSVDTEKGSSLRGDLGTQVRSSSSLSISTIDSGETRSAPDSRRESVDSSTERSDEASSAGPTSQAASPVIPSSASTVGFNLEKLREEVAQLPTNKIEEPVERPSSTPTPYEQPRAQLPARVTNGDDVYVATRPGSAPPASAPPLPTDLTALDQELDPRELLRRQWAGQAASSSVTTAAAAAVDTDDAGWGAPAAAAPSAYASPFSFTSSTSQPPPSAEPMFTFGDSNGFVYGNGAGDGRSTLDSSGRRGFGAADDLEDDDVPDPAGTFAWGNSNASTASFKTSNPW